MLKNTYILGFLCFVLSCPIYAQQSKGKAPLKKCDAGPDILNIYSVNSTRARLQFWGANVFGIDATVYDERGRLMVSASIVPTSSDITVPLNNLNPGAYKLRLSASNCQGFSEKMFSVPVVAAKKAAYTNPYVKVIAKGYAKHLDIVITGSPSNWIINDLADEVPAKGYEFRYMVNGALLLQSTPLKNYRYQSNHPLRILKMQTKPGLTSLAKWSEGERNYFFDPQAGTAFSENVTAGIYTAVFRDANSAPGFIDPIPEKYDPEKQLTGWLDYAPDMKLPKGHFWIAKRGESSVETAFKKGVTHLSNYQLPWENLGQVDALKKAGLTYNDVPRTEHFMNLPKTGVDKWSGGFNTKYWPRGPLKEQEAKSQADQTDLGHAIWIGETMEGASTMAPGEAMWGYFYKRLRERYQETYGARHIPYMIAHNYFNFWPDAFTRPVDSFPKTDFSPGGTLASTNLITEAIYINAPDHLNGTLFGSLYRMELFKRMGYNAGVFLFGVHEWKPNNSYQYTYPGGLYYFQDKMPLEPNLVIAYAFFSQLFGNLYVEWGGSGKQSTRNWDDPSGNWYPDEAPTSQPGFPYVAKEGQPSYHGYNGSSDLSYFGIKLYHDSFAKVDGGVKKFLKFRIDGKEWILPDKVEGVNIVDAHYDRRGIVLSQSKGGHVAWVYVNPYADNLAHQLEVVMPDGRIVKKTVAGDGVHVAFQ
jgi:hypothetical protein